MRKIPIRQFIFVLAMLGVFTGASQAQEATPEIIGTPQRLLFVSERDGNREIYIVNADGTGLQNLTNNPADDAYPAWSPDGSRIAFQSNREGNWDIFVMDADGGNTENLTNDPRDEQRPAWEYYIDNVQFQTDPQIGWNYAWSPNNDYWLAYRLRIENTWQIQGILYVDPSFVVGEDVIVQTLTPLGTDVGAFVWSPSADQIAFERNGEIYAVEVYHNSLPRNLTLSDAYESSPAWSPAGRQIAYVSNWEIYVMDSWDGRNAYNLSQNPAYDISPSWSPDAQQIAFASFRDENWEIYAMHSDGCNVRRLTNDEGWDGLPQWQPERERSVAVDPSSRIAATMRPPTAIVTTPNANLRDGAGENFAVIATAAQRECLTISGRSIDGAWLQIQYEDRILWVSASIVEIVGDLSSVSTLER